MENIFPFYPDTCYETYELHVTVYVFFTIYEKMYTREHQTSLPTVITEICKLYT